MTDFPAPIQQFVIKITCKQFEKVLSPFIGESTFFVQQSTVYRCLTKLPANP